MRSDQAAADDRRPSATAEPGAAGKGLRSSLVELDPERTAMETFAGVMSHELLAPLITAQTFARQIQEQLQDRVHGNTRGDLDSLIRVISRMHLLVETLLLDARSVGRPFERTPVSIERLVQDSIELLDGEIRARDARILAEDLPVVQGDAVLLGAVVNNLLINALRYGPRRIAKCGSTRGVSRPTGRSRSQARDRPSRCRTVLASSSPTTAGLTSVASRAPDWA